MGSLQSSFLSQIVFPTPSNPFSSPSRSRSRCRSAGVSGSGPKLRSSINQPYPADEALRAIDLCQRKPTNGFEHCAREHLQKNYIEGNPDNIHQII